MSTTSRRPSTNTNRLETRSRSTHSFLFHNGPVGRVFFHLYDGSVAWFRPATCIARFPCPFHVLTNLTTICPPPILLYVGKTAKDTEVIGEGCGVRGNVWRDAVCGLEAQVPLVPMEDMVSSIFGSFGTIDCGLELMSRAWRTMAHGFSIRRSGDKLPAPDRASHVLVGPHRVHREVLTEHPVDLLVVGYGHLSRPLGPHDVQPVEAMVAIAPRRPRVAWCMSSSATMKPH